MTKMLPAIASLFCVIVIITSPATAQIPYVDAVSADGPIAWWRMADATDSAGDNDGTAGSTSAFGLPGPIAGDTGGAASFDGSLDSSILVPDAPELNFAWTTDFSVEAWVYRSSGQEAVRTVCNKGDSNGSFWIRWYDDGSFRFLLDYGSTGSDVRTTNTFGVDQWHHVVATAERDNSVKIYVNGALEAETAIVLPPTNIDSPGYDLTVGEMDGGKFWNGGLDDFAVYGSALDATQVSAHFAAASAGDYATAVNADAPTAWLRLADDATDETGVHSATAGSGVTFDEASPISGDTGGAALFNGTSGASISMSDLDDLNFGSDEDFSIETWFSRDPGMNAYTAIAQKGNTDGAFWLRMDSDGTMRFLLDYGSTASSVKTSEAFDDGLWHHLVAVADRDSALQLFVDGDLVAEEPIAFNDISSPGMELQIGRLGTGTPFAGEMDEVALYDSALSLERIQAHFDAAQVPEPTGILLVFSFLGIAFLTRGARRTS